MGNVGLLLVGVVLLVNGLSSLGVVPARSAAPLNLFVGAVQVVLPTIILVQHGSDPAVLNATWPSYLFGFTYLWFGLQILYSIEPQGFGWYSAFVAAIAGYHAVLSIGTDPVFAVIWATWAVMWSLFFVLLGLGRTQVAGFDLGRFTGWFLVWLGVPTCTVSALFLLQDRWTTSPTAGLAALAGLLALTALSVALTRVGAPRLEAASAGQLAPDQGTPDEATPGQGTPAERLEPALTTSA
ncbi:amidase [Cellulomonas sp. APG4]|uniref:AmiS/UreI family transporter n=1 Tax=Cellulomonas sp. APG4 TaxID=1538656 RepID=UPI001379DCF1|nr:AmiS/UreI family transporter [Cellulomonas sp. APG4]NCT91485.1 amidase [Cellulomonas sp. APG4]